MQELFHRVGVNKMENERFPEARKTVIASHSGVVCLAHTCCISKVAGLGGRCLWKLDTKHGRFETK